MANTIARGQMIFQDENALAAHGKSIVSISGFFAPFFVLDKEIFFFFFFLFFCDDSFVLRLENL